MPKRVTGTLLQHVHESAKVGVVTASFHDEVHVVGHDAVREQGEFVINGRSHEVLDDA